MRQHANAAITVHRYEPSLYDEPAHGPALTRIKVEERFGGDIGRKQGTFLLQDSGTGGFRANLVPVIARGHRRSR